VKHLYIFGVISDDYQTNGHRFRPIALDNLKISANGSEIYHLEKLNDKEDIVESLVNQTRYRGGANVGVVTHASGKFKTTGIAGDVTVTEGGVTGAQLVTCANAYGEMIENSLVGGIKDFSFVPQNIYKVTFQNPFDFSKVSCNGVADFGQMSLPTLEGEICSGGVAGYFNNVYVGGGSNKVDIHVCATNQALISYITNSSGSTTIRSIEN